MAEIKEDYVSFEIAKLLKEKGFDEKCSRWYVANEPQEGVVEKGFGENQFYINAPTLQMAMKWLRETHDIDVSIVPLRSHKEYLPRVEANVTCHDGFPCKKYEQACETAIKYCLKNLI